MKIEELKTIVKSMIREMDVEPYREMTPNVQDAGPIKKDLTVYCETLKSLVQRIKTLVEKNFGNKFKNINVYVSANSTNTRSGAEIQINGESIKSVSMGGRLEIRIEI